MRKNFDIKSVKVFDVIRPEARVWNDLEKALKDEGVDVDAGIIQELLEFGRVVVQFKNWKDIHSKRDWDNDINFRLTNIRRLTKQLTMDNPIIDDNLGTDFLDRQLTYALIEKATLIYQEARGKDFRDVTNLDLGIFHIIKVLKERGVAKPVETFTTALERSGVLRGLIRSPWGVRTIQNKLSRISNRPRTATTVGKESPMDLAALYLQKKLPMHSERLHELRHSLSEIKEPDLYTIVPASSKFVFFNLFNNIVSV